MGQVFWWCRKYHRSDRICQSFVFTQNCHCDLTNRDSHRVARFEPTFPRWLPNSAPMVAEGAPSRNQERHFHPAFPAPRSGLVDEAGVIAADVIGRASDRAAQQMGDALLQHLVGGQTDRVDNALGFEIFVDVRSGERRIAAKVEANLPSLVAFDHRFQEAPPSVRTVDVAGTQAASFTSS